MNLKEAKAKIVILERRMQYVLAWAVEDIAAKDSFLAFEDSLVAILGIDPKLPEKEVRALILAKVSELARKAVEGCNERQG